MKENRPSLGKNILRFVGGALFFSLLAGGVIGCRTQNAAEGKVPQNAPYKDAGLPVEKRVEDLLSRMTLQEKIGQMTQIERGSLRPGDISRYFLGSVLSGGGGAPRPNTVQGWQDMIRRYQEEALATRLQIPIIYGVDAVHGHNNLQNATIFPHNIGLGATGDADLVRRIGKATALEMAATGVYWNFAPCIAVGRDPRWGRFYESYGESSALVARLGRAYIEGFKDAAALLPVRPVTTAKHFIGDGGTRWGTSKTDTYKIDQGDTVADRTYLEEVLFPPYKAAVEAGVRTIMVSFSSLNGIKMHAHRELITDVLKKSWGFTGFVVSDWGGIDQIDPDYSRAVEQGINAGIDMVMVPYDAPRFIDTLEQLVQKRKVPLSRIDDAVRRILRVKFEMGLFDAPLEAVLAAQPASVVRSADHRALAREAVAKSVVILKNNGILPLGGSGSGTTGARAEKAGGAEKGGVAGAGTGPRRLFVAGWAADDIGIQCGGWTIDWQGKPGNITAGTTILGALREALPGVEIIYDPRADFEETPGSGAGSGSGAKNAPQSGAKTASDRGELCIVVAGEFPYAEGKGDTARPELPPREQEALREARTRFKQVILVIISGRPLVLDEESLSCDAILAAWLPGTEGAGVVDILLGHVPSTGRLPCAWPRSVEQLPLDTLIQGNEKPLFPVGWGVE
ncbi:glycoside hydrolase family 3 N-terminal domain-containing protein [Treponema sp. J25]|uniref:glycoside hydrolase family 3 protein n=1 Tax=Treponema sp. J25 TaxID=2094121 RepID=UPI0014043F4A|nr:glycoside hydrolase family 3 N-terminal domain-containing protein [Treponema sp. J25]